jgi:hypothetical protein
MVRGKHGHVSVPGKVSSIIGALMITVFGTFWTILATNVGAPVAGIGVFMTGAGIVMCVVNFVKAHMYQQLREDHEQKRFELKRRLSTLPLDVIEPGRTHRWSPTRSRLTSDPGNRESTQVQNASVLREMPSEGRTGDSQNSESG